jgi:cytochrome bd ubiquinol oxidase subunit II
VPLVTAFLAVMGWRGLRGTHPALAFFAAVGLFVVAFVGLMISTFPYLVPSSITIWQAAAAPNSQTFFMAGAAILLPFILGYTVFIYHTFRGKLEEGHGYH